MKKISFTILALIATFSSLFAQHRSTFDDLGLPADTFWNGSNRSGGFLDGDAYFENSYDTLYGDWSGFGYSTKRDADTVAGVYASDYSNASQYSVPAGLGASGSNAFGISYTGSSNAIIRFDGFAPGHPPLSMYVTNTTYDYLSMRDGDAFAKKFGGATGTDPDWFRLTIYGWYQGAVIHDSIQVYLADFRSADPAQHYIQKDWKYIDLQSIGNADSLFFVLNSSDTGMFGMNTPAYFALDNFMTTDGVTFPPLAAVNDSATFMYNDTIRDVVDTAVINILANDTFSPFLSKTVTITSGPQIVGAQAYIDSNYNLVYIPVLGLASVDTLTYSLCDETGACSSASVFLTILGDGTGIIEISSTALQLYPNPAQSSVAIHSLTLMQSVSVLDMNGREVLAQDARSFSTSLNISSLSGGVYTVMIRTAAGTAVRRLIKE